MKNYLYKTLIFLIWMNTCVAEPLPDDLIYVFPKPGTELAPQAATIIVKLASPIQPGDINFKVQKPDSSPVLGEMVYSDDPRIVIFKPAKTFSLNDEILVRLSGRCSYSWNFKVVSGQIREESDQPKLNASAAGEHFANSNPTVGRIRSINGVSVPSDFPAINLNTYGETAPGKIFFASTFGNLGGYIVILNNDGTPYFYRRYPRSGDKCVGDFSLQPTGILTAYSYYYLYYIALDQNYNEIDIYKAGHGYITDSHELRVLENGHALILGQSGLNYIVQELDLNKNVIFEWNCLENYRIEDAIHGDSGDPVHMNSIAVDYDGHLILSARSQGEVSKINRETGEFIWRLGGVHNQFQFVNDPDGFTAQHHVIPVPGQPNRYTIFDNGNYHNPPYSRSVEYQLDTEAMTAELVWQYAVDEYSFMMGNTQRLPNGNTFIDYSNWPPGRALEVTPDGVVVQELEVVGTSSYRTRRYEWEGMSEVPYLIAESYSSGVVLIFNKFGDPDVVSYNIYGDKNSTPTSLLATSTETMILLTDLSDDTDYYFRITAVNSTGKESDFSNTEMVRTSFHEPGDNIVRNGDFSNSRNYWHLTTSGDAVVRGRLNTDGQYYLSIVEGGVNSTDVLLYQDGIELLNGKEYRFEFDAFADESRAIDAIIVRNESPYDNYGEIGRTALRTFSQHFVYDFTMNYPNDFSSILVFACGGSNINVTLDNISLKENVTQVSYIGTPHYLPGTIQCEEYDIGGERVAYHDDDLKEGISDFRPDDNVDVEAAQDIDGGYHVGWILSGEWLEYTVNVEPGIYEVDLRIASESAGGELEVALNGENLTTFDIPATGGWQEWQTLTQSGIQLEGGTESVLRLKIKNGNFNLNWIKFRNKMSDVQPKESQLFEFALNQNFPNPFNPVTQIQYQLPETNQVSIRVYNLLGQRICTLVDKKQLAGNHQVVWDGRNEEGLSEASGIYLVLMQAGAFSSARKITLLR